MWTQPSVILAAIALGLSVAAFVIPIPWQIPSILLSIAIYLAKTSH